MDTENRGLSSLSELLKGNNEDAAPVEAVETPPPEAASPPPEAAAASTEPKGDDDTAPPAVNESRTVPLSALEKVRSEKQELARRIAELEARVSQPEQKAPQQPLDPVTMDPAAYDFAMRARTSEAVLQAIKPDYAEALAVYSEAAKKGQAPLIPQDHPSPATFVYEQGKRLQKLNELGDLDTLETRMRQKWEAELAEVAAKQKADEAARVASQIMPTSAGVRSATPRDEEGKFTGPTPLSALLKKRK